MGNPRFVNGVHGVNGNTNIEGVHWTVQPPSKTAICHVDYKLGASANLCVIPIKITNKPTGNEPVTYFKSRRLRHNAIAEYLTIHELDHCVSVRLWAHKIVTDNNNADEDISPIDHLILFEADRARIRALTKDKTTDYVLKKTFATSKTSDGKSNALPLACSLDLGKQSILISNTNSTEYWKTLEILMRKLIVSGTLPKSKSGAIFRTKAGELLQDAPKPSKTSGPCTAMKSRITGKENSRVNVLFRTTAKLDPPQRKLRVEIDLVPGVKGDINLSELMLSVFGRSIVDLGNHNHLKEAKSLFIGLNVSRTYERLSNNPTTKAALTGSAHSIGNSALSPPSQKVITTVIVVSQTNQKETNSKKNKSSSDLPGAFPDSTVVDLKPAGEVSGFMNNDKKCSVAKYFRIILEHPHMPLANIGRDTWVPLELLKTVGATNQVQAIPCIGHMNASLQGRLKSYGPETNKTNLLDTANMLVCYLRETNEEMRKKILPEGNGKFELVNRTPIKEAPRPDRTKVSASATGSGLRFGLIYIQPKNLRSTSFQGFADAVDDLIRAQGAPGSGTRITTIDQNFAKLVAVIADVKPLLLPPSEDHPDVKAFYENSLDTIIAIIDERGRSKEEIRYLRAEMQKFGNKKVGAVVQCMNKRDLETDLDKTTGFPTHLPIGILQRLNVMHGNTNFAVKKLPEWADRKLMVVGAHISNPGSGAAASCPSVATVVGSVDATLMHYPGSARLQPTLRSTTWRHGRKNDKLKYEVESQILDLESMMKERIQAWIDQQGQTEAPHIIFYRHSNRDFDLAIRQAEMTAIQNACNEFDWGNGGSAPTFGYMLINKNAHYPSPYRNPAADTFAAHAAHTFNITDGSAKRTGHKYQYYVQSIPGDALKGTHYDTLTRYLNGNYQLDKNADVAIALPVHYAQKLARRMYDYFRFAATNSYDGLSSVQRRLEYADERAAENDGQMTAMMNEYLLNYGTVVASCVGAPERRNPWLGQLDGKMFYL
ncbi:hypothetical protein BDW02DRAFT_606010 [Decorospora gaudefroyi]|uniref:Piwi domain-containing protein n=1 Tax=Decorospora gaudefroyi TaxID=184978 RepID=A0A6A5K3L4_9PLEO|nr:hypothetical protein BDW02DRAFT_606010 [Decorospora gaudefroyi]